MNHQDHEHQDGYQLRTHGHLSSLQKYEPFDHVGDPLQEEKSRCHRMTVLMGERGGPHTSGRLLHSPGVLGQK